MKKIDNFEIILSLGVLAFLIIAIFIFTKPVPFEVEGNCNKGFIGLDYQVEVDSKYYLLYNKTYPIKIKNIDGANCNFKVKGSIPLKNLMEMFDNQIKKNNAK